MWFKSGMCFIYTLNKQANTILDLCVNECITNIEFTLILIIYTYLYIKKIYYA